MDTLQKLLRVLTLVTAGLLALIFPVMLLGIQGFGALDFELVLVVVSIYLLHPASLVLIFLKSFGRIAGGPWDNATLAIVRLNAVILLATAGAIQVGIFEGDAVLPVILAVPSMLFLLNRLIGRLKAG